MPKMIAALFVAKDGPYMGLSGVWPWTEEQDARKYAGPFPVIAHPPCERWGRYWSGGPSARVRRKLGDDNGCFAAALDAVRRYGGVLEHPADTRAWAAFCLSKPNKKLHGWSPAGDGVGWVTHVEQGNYGHPARKATWLYVNSRSALPSLKWGQSQGVRLEEGFHTSEERARARCRDQADQTDQRKRTDLHSTTLLRSHARNLSEREMRPVEFLSRKQRALTPLLFRDLLISLVRS